MRLKKREHLEGSDNNEGKEKEDTALFMNQFKGRCNYYGCMGHKAAQCNENPRNQRGRGRSFQRGGWGRWINFANSGGGDQQQQQEINNQGNFQGWGFQGRGNRGGRSWFVGKCFACGREGHSARSCTFNNDAANYNNNTRTKLC